MIKIILRKKFYFHDFSNNIKLILIVWIQS